MILSKIVKHIRLNAYVNKPQFQVCMHVLGPARYNYRVMNDAFALHKAGYKVTILDVVGSCDGCTKEVIEGISFKHVVAPGWFIPSQFKFCFVLKLIVMIMRCTFSLLLTQADIYHAHVEHTFLASYLAARIRRKTLIFDTPELTMFGPNILRWPLLRQMAIWIIRLMSKNCTVHITGSPLYKPILTDLYGNKCVQVIRHIPPHRVVVENTLFQQTLLLAPETQIALYQGNLQEDRELDTLVLAAVYLNPGIAIVMMGDDYGNCKSRLQTLIQREQLADRVKIIPAVPYAQLLDWTASATIGLTVLPPTYSLSIRLCLPNKFFEYVMAGLPILSSRLDAIAEMIQLYDIGHVLDEYTPYQIGQAINLMLADQDELLRMQANTRTALKSGLTWEEESQKLVQIYHKVFDAHHHWDLTV
ncbi:glycosyl transferase [Dictyobacter arantiisoli]|uniref:Glycosyl transferase n=2 Tax=Dictyobacter arantiisoli TaxID=2014874 RepID=A0A5A5TGC8_9CHLR|nr:glycosyl transferase [Dictyobacter arantiisoli]